MATRLFRLTKEAWTQIGMKASWFVEAMGLDGQIQSYIKKVKSKKTGQEFYTLVLYGNTQPISQFLGKPKKGQKPGAEKLFFSYFQGTWSRIIPDAFVEEVINGKSPDDPKEQQRVSSFKKAIDRLQQGFDVNGQVFKADLSALYDASEYGGALAAVQQSETSGAAKQIKDEMAQSGNTPEKLEVLKRFIDAELKRIGEMTDAAAQSAFIKSFLSFAAKFYNYSFGNQMLIWFQKPNATMVSNRSDWHKKFGREVVDYGSPITIRVPMFIQRKDVKDSDISTMKGKMMSDKEIWNKTHRLSFGVGPVYDISATQPIPGWTDENGNGPYEPQEWRQDSNETVEEIEVLVNAAAQWAEQNSIEVGYEAMSGSLGGYSAGGVIKINDKFDGINKFSTMIHECAHEVLHWENGKGKGVRNQMGKQDGRMAKEIDAESTAYIVLQHYGFETTDTPNYLAIWKATGEDILARRQNISESVRMIIKGIDDKVKNVELAQNEVDELMEQDVDERGIDMEKEKVQEVEEQPQGLETIEAPATEDVIDEEVMAETTDELLKIAKQFSNNGGKNDLRENIYGSLGLTNIDDKK